MFTIDQPKAPPQEPVKHTHAHHENKHELAGLAGLGKVSSLKHLQVKPKKRPTGLSRDDVKKELKKVFEDELDDVKENIVEEVETLLPETPRLKMYLFLVPYKLKKMM